MSPTQWPQSPPTATNVHSDLQNACRLPGVIGIGPTTTPTPRDAIWQAKVIKISEEVRRSGQVDLIFVGDSITEQFDRDVWKDHFLKWRAVNLGVSGDMTQHVLWRLLHGNIDGISPQVAVVMIGSNNANEGDEPGAIAAGIMAIVNLIRCASPGTKIVILAIFPRGSTLTDTKRLATSEASQIASRLADERMVFFREIGGIFLTPSGTPDTSLIIDTVHLNKAGYEAFANAIDSTLRNLLGGCSKSQKVQPHL